MFSTFIDSLFGKMSIFCSSVALLLFCISLSEEKLVLSCDALLISAVK